MLNGKKKVVPNLRQEVKVKVDIITCDDIKIYYTWKFQDFTARYIINCICYHRIHSPHTSVHSLNDDYWAKQPVA